MTSSTAVVTAASSSVSATEVNNSAETPSIAQAGLSDS